MIKECKVLSYNKYLNILVFVYNDKEIQTTYICENIPNTVYVKFDNGRYRLVSRRSYEKQNRKPYKTTNTNLSE